MCFGPAGGHEFGGKGSVVVGGGSLGCGESLMSLCLCLCSCSLLLLLRLLLWDIQGPTQVEAWRQEAVLEEPWSLQLLVLPVGSTRVRLVAVVAAAGWAGYGYEQQKPAAAATAVDGEQMATAAKKLLIHLSNPHSRRLVWLFQVTGLPRLTSAA